MISLSQITGLITRPIHLTYNPIYVNLETNNTCNLKCTMCLRNNYSFKEKFLSFEKFKVIYDKINPTHIGLHGYGEPLLNKDLFQMIKYTAKRSKVCVTTNGTLLDKYTDQLINHNTNSIKVSIDAANKTTYKKIRGADYFDKIINNLKMLQDEKRVRRTKFPIIRFNFVIHQLNFNEITGVIKLAKNLEIKTVYFQALLFQDLIKALKLKLKKIELSPRDMIAQIENGILQSKKNNIITNLNEIKKNFPYIWNYYKKDNFSKENNRKCLKPWTSVFISVNGDVKPCDCLGLTNTVMGNIFTQDFNSILNSNNFKRFRTKIKAGKRPHPICKECFPQNILELINLRKYGAGFLKNDF